LINYDKTFEVLHKVIESALFSSKSSHHIILAIVIEAVHTPGVFPK
jgi:hypothetical protein